jgi:cytochrome c oxidase assembly protein subunit 15
VLVGVELAQGVIGFVQYFLHLPALVVGLHMAGACAVWLAVLTLVDVTFATPRAMMSSWSPASLPPRSATDSPISTVTN